MVGTVVGCTAVAAGEEADSDLQHEEELVAAEERAVD